MTFLLDFLYPPECLHCQMKLPGKRKVFCEQCAEDLSWVVDSERCAKCLTPFEGKKKRCMPCLDSALPIEKVGAVLEKKGAAFELFEQKEVLAKTLGALLFYKWESLKWQSDCHILGEKPLPRSFYKWMPLRGQKKLYITSELRSREDLVRICEKHSEDLYVLSLFVGY